MKAIRGTMCRYIAAAVSGAVIGISLLIWLSGRFIAPFILFSAAAVFTALALREAVRLHTAQVITENGLLQTCFATIAETDHRPASDTGLEAIVSCFGVLLGSRVIGFNRRANRLWRVEIGRDSIDLVYGPKARIRHLTLLHAPMGIEDSHALAERFRFETGAETVVRQDF